MTAIPQAVSGLAADAPILSSELPGEPAPLRRAITAAWMRDETEHVRELLEQARLPAEDQAKAQALAADLVTRVRARAGPGRHRSFHAPVRPGQRGRRAADVRG